MKNTTAADNPHMEYSKYAFSSISTHLVTSVITNIATYDNVKTVRFYKTTHIGTHMFQKQWEITTATCNSNTQIPEIIKYIIQDSCNMTAITVTTVSASDDVKSTSVA